MLADCFAKLRERRKAAASSSVFCEPSIEAGTLLYVRSTFMAVRFTPSCTNARGRKPCNMLKWARPATSTLASGRGSKVTGLWQRRGSALFGFYTSSSGIHSRAGYDFFLALGGRHLDRFQLFQLFSLTAGIYAP